MVYTEHIGEFAAGEYTLKSAGFLGGMHVLVVGELSLIGQAGTLSRDEPLTLVKLTERRVLGVYQPKPVFLAIQPGGRLLEMVEGTADDIVEVLRREPAYFH